MFMVIPHPQCRATETLVHALRMRWYSFMSCAGGGSRMQREVRDGLSHDPSIRSWCVVLFSAGETCDRVLIVVAWQKDWSVAWWVHGLIRREFQYRCGRSHLLWLECSWQMVVTRLDHVCMSGAPDCHCPYWTGVCSTQLRWTWYCDACADSWCCGWMMEQERWQCPWCCDQSIHHIGTGSHWGTIGRFHNHYGGRMVCVRRVLLDT